MYVLHTIITETTTAKREKKTQINKRTAAVIMLLSCVTGKTLIYTHTLTHTQHTHAHTRTHAHPTCTRTRTHTKPHVTQTGGKPFSFSYDVP